MQNDSFKDKRLERPVDEGNATADYGEPIGNTDETTGDAGATVAKCADGTDNVEAP
ncbi:hypothetical protein PF005_g1521 [Phytophthora fragariae]|uniref:Uncharacterized protein n=1 Tax=Phytophthora fragariae TaxID=53985 RepID=A0A6A4AE55_9STRA|nr:hypothetical protein PF011_g836 [Phytophthora fragariae]KAE9231494.1 hypothetical protein PF004_g10210 [Phytophthora fragariae]KAE9235363.1 hypothetical protein PF005_g1521 [Phytophthora fragariae]KAE9256675.1 hypothetical protein PF002_g1742 [Phytophthora fragariae]